MADVKDEKDPFDSAISLEAAKLILKDKRSAVALMIAISVSDLADKLVAYGEQQGIEKCDKWLCARGNPELGTAMLAELAARKESP